MPFLAAIDELHAIIGTAAALLVCGLAVALGGSRERLAGLLQFADVFGIAMLAAMLEREDRFLVVQAKALLVLAAYVALTVRWPDRWLILLCGLQAFAVLLHLSVWWDRSILASVNGLLLNLTGWAMLAVLLAATMASIGRRGRHRPPAAQGKA